MTFKFVAHPDDEIESMNMKILFLIFLLTFSCHANAEWVEYLTRTNGDIFYFDNARVDRSGDLVTVWNRIRYKTSVMGASSYQNLIEIDCSEFTEAILQSTFFIDQDWTTPAMATDNKKKPKVSIKTKSATEHLANILCK